MLSYFQRNDLSLILPHSFGKKHKQGHTMTQIFNYYAPSATIDACLHGAVADHQPYIDCIPLKTNNSKPVI